ncbi:MAG: glycosyltransferase family 4 protein [Verrucomicrobiota bacterium]|jgi:alpha-maltose-1-phosphate synthase
MIYIVCYNSPYVGGGVEQVVRRLVDAFSSTFKEDLRLICNDPSQEDEFQYGGVRCFNLKTARFNIADRLFFWGRYVYSHRIYTFLKAKARDGDVVNIHGIEYALFPSLLRDRIPSDIKLIVTAHGSNFDSATRYLVRGMPWKLWYVKGFYYFYRWIIFLMEKLTCYRVDYFTFITKYIQNCYTANYQVKKETGCVIYNGLSQLKGRARPPKKDPRFAALIVGSTVYQKGLDHAEAIIKLLRKQGVDVSLTAIGFPDHPRVPPENMAMYYEKADFLLLPSRCEGFPLTVLEALQHRLPVVVSKACAFDEVPGHENVGIIVDNFDYNSWADAIRKSLLDLNQYNRLVEHLNPLDLGAFDWNKIAPEYERILKTGT